MIPVISPPLKSLVSCVGVVMIVALASGEAIAQGNGRSSSLPFANTYSKPKLSPYSALANLNPAGAAGAGAHGAHDHSAEPTVELITNNGRIEKVVVTCSCSRRIELDCTY